MPQTAPLADLMAEMAATIEDALGSAVDQVTPLMNLNPTGLSVDIYPAPAFRDPEQAGFGEVNGAYLFTVRARLDIGDLDGSQEALIALMDDEASTSLGAALYDDQTLNGYASAVRVDGPSGFIPYTDSPGTTVGVEWNVLVIRALS